MDLDWNGKLHVVNGSPLAKPWPVGPFWAVTDDGEVLRLEPYTEADRWTGGRNFTIPDDPERGTFDADQLLGWCDSYDDACEVAALYLKEAA